MTNSTAREVSFPAGTELLAGPDGIPFELGSDTSVPAGATVTQGVKAREAGVRGNVAAAAIARWKEPQYAAVAVTNPAPATGGTVEMRPAVDQADVVALNELAAALGRSESVRRLVMGARPHDAVFLGTAEASVEAAAASLPAGAPADVLTMAVKVTVSALAILEGTLDTLARNLLGADRGHGEFIPGSVKAVETGARQVSPETGTIRTEIEVTGLFARNVTRGTIRDAVTGRSPASAKSTLSKRYGIDDANVQVSPGWAPWLPRFGFRIDVELRSRPSAPSRSAEGIPGNDATPAPTSRAGTPAPGH